MIWNSFLGEGLWSYGTNKRNSEIFEHIKANKEIGVPTGKFCEECGSPVVSYPEPPRYDPDTGAKVPVFAKRCSSNCDHMRGNHGWSDNHKKAKIDTGISACTRCGDVFNCWGMPGF